MRFHSKKGSNVTLLEPKRTIARRNRSFANAIVFSSRPLEKNETFEFEIERIEPGWAGHLRCGITTLSPIKTTLPPYLLPDFASIGKSWVYAIKPSHDRPFGDDLNNFSLFDSSYDIPKCSEVTCGIHPDLLVTNKTLLPTDVGSRIGIHITSDGKLYFILNGVQFGPCAEKIPISTSFLYAVVDLYGTTKQIKIVPNRASSLKTICSEVIREHMTDEQVVKSSLPGFVKDYIMML